MGKRKYSKYEVHGYMMPAQGYIKGKYRTMRVHRYNLCLVNEDRYLAKYNYSFDLKGLKYKSKALSDSQAKSGAFKPPLIGCSTQN